MKGELLNIPLSNLALMVLPVGLVLWQFKRLSIGAFSALYANLRMLVQLLLIGYVLVYIFKSENPLVVLLVLSLMLCAAALIAVRSVKQNKLLYFRLTLLCISVGGIPVLALVTQGVLQLSPWYSPHALIPLAGMIFSSSMNAVSLGAERYYSEIASGNAAEAQQRAFNAAMIPIMNMLFAVGLVSLPGMMTGQILAGVDPLLAVRYQIMVMTMIFGASGISTALFLWIAERMFSKDGIRHA